MLQKILSEAQDLGIQLVGIRMPHKLLKRSQSFPWPETSLFANGRLKHHIFEPCAAWEIAKRAEVWDGCGNNNQACLSYKASKELKPGVWQLQADGWVQIA